MVYEYVLTVPAGTPKDSPATKDALVAPGVVTQVEVEMAPGCHRMVHAVVTEGNFQLWPRNPEGTIATDGHVITFKEHIELKRGHNHLKVKGWSPGTTYNHDVTVRIVMMPKAIASILPLLELLSGFIRRFERFIGLA